MKLPGRIRQLTRTALGLRKSEAITPAELQTLVSREEVIVVSVGIMSNGAADERLPGVQRSASLGNLAAVLADVPKHRAIVTHCG